jgi:hypothetical protein
MSTKVKNIEEKSFQGKVTGHIITLEDNTVGYLDDKNSDKVIVGDNVDCTLTVKKNKRGTDYNLLTLKRVVSSQTPVGAGGATQLMGELKTTRPSLISPIDVFHAKVAASNNAMHEVMIQIWNDQMTDEKLKEHFINIRNWVWASIDECSQ